MRSAIVVCVLAAGLLVGCGDSKEDAGSVASDCIVLANGSELCGDEARAWCDGFASDTDRGTAEACGSMLPAESQCSAYAPGTPAFLDCSQRAQDSP